MKNSKNTCIFVLLAMALSLSFSSCMIDFEWGWPEQNSVSGGTKKESVYKKTEKESEDGSERKKPVVEQKEEHEVKQEPESKKEPEQKKEFTTKAENLVTVTTVGKDDISIEWNKTAQGLSFSAPEGFVCKWYVEGILQSNDFNNEFAMNTHNLTAGVYNIMVVAEKDGFAYSAHLNVFVE